MRFVKRRIGDDGVLQLILFAELFPERQLQVCRIDDLDLNEPLILGML